MSYEFQVPSNENNNMPELPEVETIVRDLRQKLIGKKISNVDILLKKTVNGDLNDFLTKLQYNKIKAIERRGKLMIFHLAKNGYLLAHLRMTGQLVYCAKGRMTAGGHSEKERVQCEPTKHTRAIIVFSDKSRLFFNDLRTFGFLQIVSKEQSVIITARYGREALELDHAYLKSVCKGRNTNIKQLLLDQKLIAGIGNIYADEALFLSGISPKRKAGSLDDAELKKLSSAIKNILQKAIKFRGTTFNNYRDADGRKGDFVKMLNAYGRKGEKCRRCGSLIQKIKLGQRGTSFCDRCQK